MARWTCVRPEVHISHMISSLADVGLASESSSRACRAKLCQCRKGVAEAGGGTFGRPYRMPSAFQWAGAGGKQCRSHPHADPRATCHQGSSEPVVDSGCSDDDGAGPCCRA